MMKLEPCIILKLFRVPTPLESDHQNLLNRTKILQNLPNGKKILQILLNGTRILQDLLKRGKALGCRTPLNPPVCTSMVSSDPCQLTEKRYSLPKIKNVVVLQGQIFLHGNLLQNIILQGWAVISGFSRVKENPGFFRVFQGLLATPHWEIA